MENYGIDNSQISASSETSIESSKYGPQSARLNNMYVWRANENRTEGEYIQIDLGQLKTLTAVAVQGDENGLSWVTSFTIKNSNDNQTWEEFQVIIQVHCMYV